MNVARTFGDDELKEAISRIEVGKLPELLSEVERAIGILNQKEAFESTDETRHYINEAMADIMFNFRVKSEEEMEMTAGKQEEFQRKWQRVIRGFIENIDQEDPEYVSLREAFMQRFKERGFIMETLDDFDEESRALDEVMDKLTKIKRGNDALSRRYRGDAKFVRVHKRLHEENVRRATASEEPMVAAYDEDIVDFLTEIKHTIDQKVYDRNDILKKDDYFERTVMTLITTGMKNIGFDTPRADRLFIQDRISRQYLDQYHATYNIAA